MALRLGEGIRAKFEQSVRTRRQLVAQTLERHFPEATAAAREGLRRAWQRAGEVVRDAAKEAGREIANTPADQVQNEHPLTFASRHLDNAVKRRASSQKSQQSI